MRAAHSKHTPVDSFWIVGSIGACGATSQVIRFSAPTRTASPVNTAVTAPKRQMRSAAVGTTAITTSTPDAATR